MNTISARRLTYDSNRMIFAKNALLAVLVLLVFFSVNGSLSIQNLRELSIYFTFTPIAAGISGIIFKNTVGLRQSTGFKKVMGWAIGLLAYGLFIPLALALG
ncbi:hypothetical protein [Algoriphagus limi]|uniref:Uncharacterized protein n=1 Tax=Algoriphagus limi TaxID=2975273 RepID=A0ABT2G7W1_9BACT|nr:hypothetical protein [Algoriphagus limi]MCS5490838.1 hypothetical protein [Algoriphagus limi]